MGQCLGKPPDASNSKDALAINCSNNGEHIKGQQNFRAGKAADTASVSGRFASCLLPGSPSLLAMVLNLNCLLISGGGEPSPGEAAPAAILPAGLEAALFSVPSKGVPSSGSSLVTIKDRAIAAASNAGASTAHSTGGASIYESSASLAGQLVPINNSVSDKARPSPSAAVPAAFLSPTTPHEASPEENAEQLDGHSSPPQPCGMETVPESDGTEANADPPDGFLMRDGSSNMTGTSNGTTMTGVTGIAAEAPAPEQSLKQVRPHSSTRTAAPERLGGGCMHLRACTQSTCFCAARGWSTTRPRRASLPHRPQCLARYACPAACLQLLQLDEAQFNYLPDITTGSAHELMLSMQVGAARAGTKSAAAMRRALTHAERHVGVLQMNTRCVRVRLAPLGLWGAKSPPIAPCQRQRQRQRQALVHPPPQCMHACMGVCGAAPAPMHKQSSSQGGLGRARESRRCVLLCPGAHVAR